jgi:hypothetical protein
MSCGPIDFLQGGTLVRPRIVDPEITGGTYTLPTLSNISVAGPIALADDALASLVGILDPLIRGVVDPDDVAKVFRDATNNLPLVPDTQIVTKADSEAFTARVEAELAALTPDVFAGALHDSTNDLPLVAETQVVTKDDLDALLIPAVADVFRNSEGLALPPGTWLMSAQEVQDYVAKTICDGCGDAGLSELLWDPDEKLLTARSENMSGEIKEVSVVLTGLAEAPVPGPAPAEASGVALPSVVVGARTQLLGRPDLWIRFRIGADEGVVPWYRTV